MSSEATSLSQERAQQKQLEREQDARALASGEKTREQLRAERGVFAFPSVRLRLDLVKLF
ncbi:MAG: hypothetical protein MUF64_28585 [Polyangiaceae bacterium]|nr:hypothetical protein [Polyangiaceae bacterium]